MSKANRTIKKTALDASFTREAARKAARIPPRRELLRGWKAVDAAIHARLKIGHNTLLRRSQDILELPTWCEGGNVVAYAEDIEKWCDEVAQMQRGK